MYEERKEKFSFKSFFLTLLLVLLFVLLMLWIFPTKWDLDKKYGNLKGKRLLLCANRLDIRDPKSRKVLSFEINVPREYMRNL